METWHLSMKNNKNIIIISSLIILLIIFLGIGYFFLKQQKENSNYVKIDTESTNLEVEYSEKELNGEWTDYTAKITLDDTKTTIEGKGVTNSGNTIIIQSAGTYYITGSISDGNILIQAGKDDDVQLVLDNVSITSQKTAPINGVTANKLTMILAEGSVNTGTDSSSYTTFTDQESLEPDGAIFTKTDLVINGTGKLTVNASGDGLDANGSIYINGGTIVVAGPTSSGNGALDYDSECVVTGGELIFYGSNGMWQNPSSTSTQYCLAFQTSGNSGDEIVLKDNNGNTITSFQTEKTYSIIAISNEKIEKGKTYSLYVNDVSVGSLETNSIITSNFSNGMNGGNDMNRGGGMKKGF